MRRNFSITTTDADLAMLLIVCHDFLDEERDSPPSDDDVRSLIHQLCDQLYAELLGDAEIEDAEIGKMWIASSHADSWQSLANKMRTCAGQIDHCLARLNYTPRRRRYMTPDGPDLLALKRYEDWAG